MIEPITAEQMRDDFSAATDNIASVAASPRELVRVFADQNGLRVSDLTGRGRTADIAHPRQDLMALIKRRTSASLSDIGRVLGGRDHTTVAHGIKASIARGAS